MKQIFKTILMITMILASSRAFSENKYGGGPLKGAWDAQADIEAAGVNGTTNLLDDPYEDLRKQYTAEGVYALCGHSGAWGPAYVILIGLENKIDPPAKKFTTSKEAQETLADGFDNIVGSHGAGVMNCIKARIEIQESLPANQRIRARLQAASQLLQTVSDKILHKHQQTEQETAATLDFVHALEQANQRYVAP